MKYTYLLFAICALLLTACGPTNAQGVSVSLVPVPPASPAPLATNTPSPLQESFVPTVTAGAPDCGSLVEGTVCDAHQLPLATSNPTIYSVVVMNLIGDARAYYATLGYQLYDQDMMVPLVPNAPVDFLFELGTGSTRVSFVLTGTDPVGSVLYIAIAQPGAPIAFVPFAYIQSYESETGLIILRYITLVPLSHAPEA